MNRLPKLCITAGCLSMAILLHEPGLAQAVSMDSQMNEVIKLRVHRVLQSTEETAAGVFVGKDRRTAYFITACHAVIQDDARVRSIKVRFHNSPRDVDATVFELYDAATLDLAVVTVSVAELPADLPEIVRKDPALGTPIHVIGHPAAGDWSVASGTVQNLNSGNGDIHHFTTSRDNSLAEGHSGGPVFDAMGDFLGMHTASAPTYGIEAKSSEIMVQLAAWHVPTNNVTSVVDEKPTSGNSSSHQTERDAIDRTVEAYVDAYNKKDAQSLWQIWPSSPMKTKQSIEAYFRNARSITMHVTDRKIESSGARATVMAQSFQEFLPKSGSLQKSPESPITFELEKNGANWLITVVR